MPPKEKVKETGTKKSGNLLGKRGIKEILFFLVLALIVLGLWKILEFLNIVQGCQVSNEDVINYLKTIDTSQYMPDIKKYIPTMETVENLKKSLSRLSDFLPLGKSDKKINTIGEL